MELLAPEKFWKLFQESQPRKDNIAQFIPGGPEEMELAEVSMGDAQISEQRHATEIL